ncbi:hypothetical protein [Mesorhizobium sp. 113-1-2]|uniref:hypothetical protein n=1 Tax=Mesorhizobium sp. 113-1-2 TaxID=2744515 RepID=UPI001928A6AB|nr:hypothetical protein [Mesorhizobium sp. 113-1-2]
MTELGELPTALSILSCPGRRDQAVERQWRRRTLVSEIARHIAPQASRIADGADAVNASVVDRESVLLGRHEEKWADDSMSSAQELER